MRSVRKQLFVTELGIVFLEAPVIEPVTVRFTLYGIEFVIVFFVYCDRSCDTVFEAVCDSICDRNWDRSCDR